jgi:hypothetical protein
MLTKTIWLLAILSPTWVYAFNLTNSAVINVQDQHIMTATLNVPGGTMDISANTQWQKGAGHSAPSSFACDIQSQGGNALGTTNYTSAGGYALDGTYKYYNAQTSMTLNVSSDIVGNATGVGVVQGALAYSTGDAFSMSSGYVSNGDFDISNTAFSDSNIISVNTGGFLDADPNYIGE